MSFKPSDLQNQQLPAAKQAVIDEWAQVSLTDPRQA